MERSPVLFNSLFPFSPFRAWHLRREPVLTLRWMTRAIAVLLTIATTRPVMGTFLATRSVTHLSPEQFFGVAFWIGFSINILIVELGPRSQEAKSQIERMAMRPLSLSRHYREQDVEWTGDKLISLTNRAK